MDDRDPKKVAEDRQGFDDEPLAELFEIGPDDELDAADLAGIADIAAGRVVSNAAVIRWLDDYVAGIRRPRPRVGE